MFNVRRGFTPRIRASHVVAGAALVLITTGGATAAGMISGKDIKNNSVSTKDVKNGSLTLKDFKASERSKLIGPAGPAGTAGTAGTAGGSGANGATGATGPTGAPGTPGTNGTNGTNGASAFAPPPSGTVITGGGILSVELDGAGVPLRSYAPLPFTPATPFTTSAGRNLHFGSTGFDAQINPTDIDATACPGDAAAPAPTAGQLCVYPKVVSNFGSMFVYAGVDTAVDPADSTGFYVFGDSNAAGSVTLRYVWAYKAP